MPCENDPSPRDASATDWERALDLWEAQIAEAAQPFSPPEGWWEESFAHTPSPSEQKGHRCGEKQMLMLVAYDIADPKRLSKVARHCEDWGMRIQYSIFECRLEAGAFDEFWEGLLELIDEEDDRVTAYRICVACAREVRDAGAQTHSEKVVAYVF